MAIPNFDEAAKKQLTDLAEIINRFNHERVQLRVLDYLGMPEREGTKTMTAAASEKATVHDPKDR